MEAAATGARSCPTWDISCVGTVLAWRIGRKRETNTISRHEPHRDLPGPVGEGHRFLESAGQAGGAPLRFRTHSVTKDFRGPTLRSGGISAPPFVRAIPPRYPEPQIFGHVFYMSHFRRNSGCGLGPASASTAVSGRSRSVGPGTATARSTRRGGCRERGRFTRLGGRRRVPRGPPRRCGPVSSRDTVSPGWCP